MDSEIYNLNFFTPSRCTASNILSVMKNISTFQTSPFARNIRGKRMRVRDRKTDRETVAPALKSLGAKYAGNTALVSIYPVLVDTI